MEIWSKGKVWGTVITNTSDGLPEKCGHSGSDANEYYGGSLVCESIWRQKDVSLISAAPDMLNVLSELIEWEKCNHIEIELFVKIKNAVNKATDKN